MNTFNTCIPLYKDFIRKSAHIEIKNKFTVTSEKNRNNSVKKLIMLKFDL